MGIVFASPLSLEQVSRLSALTVGAERGPREMLAEAPAAQSCTWPWLDSPQFVPCTGPCSLGKRSLALAPVTVPICLTSHPKASLWAAEHSATDPKSMWAPMIDHQGASQPWGTLVGLPYYPRIPHPSHPSCALWWLPRAKEKSLSGFRDYTYLNELISREFNMNPLLHLVLEKNQKQDPKP